MGVGGLLVGFRGALQSWLQGDDKDGSSTVDIEIYFCRTPWASVQMLHWFSTSSPYQTPDFLYASTQTLLAFLHADICCTRDFMEAGHLAHCTNPSPSAKC